MRIEVAIGVFERVESGSIDHLTNNFIHKLAVFEDLTSLLGIQNCWSFVFKDLFVPSYSEHQTVTHVLGLSDCVVVTRVRQVKTTVQVNSDVLLLVFAILTLAQQVLLSQFIDLTHFGLRFLLKLTGFVTAVLAVHLPNGFLNFGVIHNFLCL